MIWGELFLEETDKNHGYDLRLNLRKCTGWLCIFVGLCSFTKYMTFIYQYQ